MPAKTGTGFVNFQDLVDLNRPQAENQAQNLYNNINVQGQGIQQSTQQAEQDYSEKAKAGLSIAPDPTAISATEDTKGNKTFTGPQSTYTSPGALDVNKQRTQADQFSRNLSSLQSVGGFQGQFQQQNHAQPYTQGQSRMDAALTQNVAGNRFNELRAKYAGVYDNVTAAQSRASQLDNDYRKQAGDAQAATEATLAAARAGEETRQTDAKVRGEQAKVAEARERDERNKKIRETEPRMDVFQFAPDVDLSNWQGGHASDYYVDYSSPPDGYSGVLMPKAGANFNHDPLGEAARVPVSEPGPGAKIGKHRSDDTYVLPADWRGRGGVV